MNNTTIPAIRVAHISVGYSEKKTILSDISFEIPSGARCAIIGLNGSGKTTLLNSILGLIPHFGGNILFFNTTLDNARNRIAYVPQIKSVDWNFPITVKKVVEMGCFKNKNYFFLEKASDYKNKVENALRIMNLTHIQNNQINQLSGGQKQRTFIARALAQAADLYILDEPLTGLDILSEEIITKLFFALSNEHKTILAVHHDIHTLYDYFNWVIIIHKGIMYNGPLEKNLVDGYIKKAFYEI
jgi:manganese/zinc/iron transport system ATP- binding protein